MASIKKLASGKWQARYRDEDGKQRSKNFPRQVDAQRWMNEITASIVTGQYVDPTVGRITFREYYKRYAARQMWVAGTVKAMNLAAYSTSFVDLPMGRIRSSDVEEWVKSMSASLQPGTVKTRYDNVRAVFKAARRDLVIASDPTDGVKLPRRRRPSAAMSIPSPEQVSAIMAAADDRFSMFIALCAIGGLRLGEAAGVQLGDIDWKQETVAVSRQVQRADGGGVEIHAPKCGSERVVYLPTEIMEMLSEHVKADRARILSQGWLFAGAGDDPLNQNGAHRQWREALRAAGLSNIKLHDLRHFYASGLIAAGCDPVTVQRSLGHKSASITLNTYSHLWPKAEDRTRSAASAMMTAVFAAPVHSLCTETASQATDLQE